MSPTLLLIDIQRGVDNHAYYGGHRNNVAAEANAAKLLAFWRKKGWPVIHVKHNSVNEASPLAAGKPTNEIKPEVAPLDTETVIEKQTNSAFVHTDLHARLKVAGTIELVIAGLTTDHCISASVRSASDLGYQVWLPAEATATFDKVGYDGQKVPAETLYQATLASLHGEFAEVIGLSDLLAHFQG